MYAVTDSVLSYKIMQTVQLAVGQGGAGNRVYTLKARQLKQAMRDPGKLLALNAIGRQCFLVFSHSSGRPATYLVHVPSSEVHLLPLRFDKAMFETDLVVKCTVSNANKLLVLDDIPGEKDVNARVHTLHSIVHDAHTPDAFLFPLRVVARRFYVPGQVAELREQIATGTIRYHSISILDSNGVERRALVGCKNRADKNITSEARDQSTGYGSQRSVEVMRLPGPDLYRMRALDAPDSWDFLGVQTMHESSYLAHTIPSQGSCKAQVWYDGSRWRIVL